APPAGSLGSAHAGSLILRLRRKKHGVISLMGVIVETPPPILNRLPQELIQVPAWPSLVHWHPGRTSPTSSVLDVPSSTSAMLSVIPEKANIPEICSLFMAA